MVVLLLLVVVGLGELPEVRQNACTLLRCLQYSQMLVAAFQQLAMGMFEVLSLTRSHKTPPCRRNRGSDG